MNEKYHTATKICHLVMNELITLIKSSQMLNLYELHIFGNKRINEECSNIYKKEKNKGVAFPTSISLNNCVGNYLYESKSETIQQNDIVKIELGVNIAGCTSILGETIIYTRNDVVESDVENDIENDIVENKVVESDVVDHKKMINLLDLLKDKVIELLKSDNTTEDIQMEIESICTEYNCFPVENTISYEYPLSEESKYFLLNYKKKIVDEEEITPHNISFELEKGNIFMINLSIVQNDRKDNHIYIKKHDSHIYRLNDYFYNLKLKNSREFYSMIKTNHGINAFNCIDYKENVRYRLGIKECLDNGILDDYTILYNKNGLPVFHKKFMCSVSK